MWGIRRDAGVNMRDTVMAVGGRCHLIASDAIRGGRSGGFMGWKGGLGWMLGWI